mgnify:CR=1 FL=1
MDCGGRSPDWELRHTPFYAVNIGTYRHPITLRTRICLRCGAYSAVVGLTPGNCAERFQEQCSYIEAVQLRTGLRCRRCGCPEAFAGRASWCCEVVHGIACDFADGDRESEVASDVDDGLAVNAEDEFDSSDEENPWNALRMAPARAE